MDKKERTRFGTIFFLACCLLTLTTPACSGGDCDSQSVSAPKNVTSADLQTAIKSAPKPFVLVNFYAQWCKPCLKEMPELVAMQNDPESQVAVLLVSIDEKDGSGAKVKQFLCEAGVNFATYAVTHQVPEFVNSFYASWDGNIPLSLIYSRDDMRLIEAISGITDRAEVELIVNMHSKLGS